MTADCRWFSLGRPEEARVSVSENDPWLRVGLGNCAWVGVVAGP